MMLCHSILRTLLSNYTLKSLGASDDYIRVLTLINDNEDGKQGALSI